MKPGFFCIILISLLFLTAFQKPVHKKLIIAVIDTGVDLEDIRFKDLICDSKDFTGTGIKDNMGHGTHVLGIIKKYAKNSNYCFVVLKYFNSYTDTKEQIENSLNTLYFSLLSYHPDVVNYSGGGPFLESEYNTIKEMKTTKFFVAAGNENQNIDILPFYPASLPFFNVIPIGSLDGHIKANSSNWGSRVVWEQGVNILSTVPYSINSSGYMYMSGTSMATARATGEYIYEH